MHQATVSKRDIKMKYCEITATSCGPKFVFYKSWFDAGITEVNNLLNEQGDILELHDFTWKFHFNVSLTKYYGLLSAIPKEMERNSNLNNPTWTVDRNNAVFILSTRCIYSSVFVSVFVPPTAAAGTKLRYSANDLQEVTFKKFISCLFWSQ